MAQNFAGLMTPPAWLVEAQAGSAGGDTHKTFSGHLEFDPSSPLHGNPFDQSFAARTITRASIPQRPNACSEPIPETYQQNHHRRQQVRIDLNILKWCASRSINALLGIWTDIK